MRTLTLLISLCMASSSFADAYKAELKATWLGVAGLQISDGETSILFDPIVTYPGLKQWFSGAKFESDPDQVTMLESKIHLEKTKGIFISHTHFDHAVDAPAISKLTNAKVYGGPSVEHLLAYSGNSGNYAKMSDGVPIVIGSFKITPIRRQHAPILSLFQFLPGELPSTFKAGFYEYNEGEVWCFYIEHPSGTILIDQGSHFFEANNRYADKVDYYFVGVANKISVNDIVMGNIAKIRPTLAIPLHFDYFMTNHEFLQGKVLPGMALDAIGKELTENVLKTHWLVPQRFEEINLSAQQAR